MGDFGKIKSVILAVSDADFLGNQILMSTTIDNS